MPAKPKGPQKDDLYKKRVRADLARAIRSNIPGDSPGTHIPRLTLDEEAKFMEMLTGALGGYTVLEGLLHGGRKI